MWFWEGAAASIDESAARQIGAGKSNIEVAIRNGKQLAPKSLRGREGDERLSAKDRTADRRPTEIEDAENGSGRDMVDSSDHGSQSKRHGKPAGDLGRALKTVYDDTLREDVPKDFLDLLGKLS